MNYNNFSCRLSLPRIAIVAREKPIVKEEPKKARKTTRRRLAPALAAAILVLVWPGTGFCAAPLDDAPRWVPAPNTVPFAEAPDRPAGFDWAEEEMILVSEPAEHALVAHVEAVATQVLAAAQPTPAQASVLTLVFLCGGLGVGLFQARHLFRRDLSC